MFPAQGWAGALCSVVCRTEPMYASTSGCRGHRRELVVGVARQTAVPGEHQGETHDWAAATNAW